MIVTLLSLILGVPILIAMFSLIFVGFAVTESVYDELVAKEDQCGIKGTMVFSRTLQ